jgi:uncharacterized protein YjbI with pentapeptide repeats
MFSLPDIPAVVPRRAPVIPRVRGVGSADAEELPLEYYIDRLLGQRARMPVNVFGLPGSGKSTALAHLAASFPDRLALIDGPLPVTRPEAWNSRLVVYATVQKGAGTAFEMMPWRQDDLIEYLLHKHREQCKSVMARVTSAAYRDDLCGSPELWSIVLDAFAADTALADIPTALRRHFLKMLGGEKEYRKVASQCLGNMQRARRAQTEPDRAEVSAAKRSMNRFVVVLLASENLADRIAAEETEILENVLPCDLLDATGPLLQKSAAAWAKLVRTVQRFADRQPMGCSLMVRGAPAWCPDFILRNLKDAQLAGVRWPGVNLSGCDLRRCNLVGADLRDAKLISANALGANLRNVRLCRGQLEGMLATDADMSGADLTQAKAVGASFPLANLANAVLRGAQLDKADFNGARLEGGDFTDASLVEARLSHTKVDGADFSGVDFSGAMIMETSFRGAGLLGASFKGAQLIHCDLEGINLPGADFQLASLKRSYLTGSAMPGANFHGASLREAGLAGVDWEDADLSEVDFEGASFHMGSSRSGLVNSPIASEGTRTGFYTDDYNDQDYKAPEEIRKANLCGCDLRGAHVEKTDFYLVDLRRASYTADQGQHFARCGAILRSRA